MSKWWPGKKNSKPDSIYNQIGVDQRGGWPPSENIGTLPSSSALGTSDGMKNDQNIYKRRQSKVQTTRKVTCDMTGYKLKVLQPRGQPEQIEVRINAYTRFEKNKSQF